MRILLAVAIVSGGIAATVAAALFLREEAITLWLFLVAGAVTSFLGGLLLAQYRFRERNVNAMSLVELERQGLTEMNELAAVRAFQVEELEDEGLHYFLELSDASVLYLQGQYLDEYEPESSQPRRFPCTDFSIVRDARTAEIVDLRCRGVPLEPEAVLPPFPAKFLLAQVSYPAGQIVSDKSYEAIKAELEVLTAR